MGTAHQSGGGGEGSKSRAERNLGAREEDEPRNGEAGLQQQPQQRVVRWERFLPVRTLKVLLVESDDSTRQLVSALLRNSSYEVTAAANGQQAWDILEDLTNHIDLILTEVVMPCMSGTDLLCKIMSHKTRKNIPVIMMSSNDSMHTVFSCLSKGAVDFLVKPIRKNELKNLWQHVWRRCHCASVSGSESDMQTEKHAKSKSGDDSQNSIGSNEDDNGLIRMNKSDGSDNGSGTQNSWTKRAVEVDSPQPLSLSDQSAVQHDSSSALITHLKTESFCKGWVPMTKSTESIEQNELADYFMGKDLQMGVNSDTQHEAYPTEKVSTEFTNGIEDQLPQNDPKNEVILGPESSNASDKLSTQAADLIGLIANNTVAQVTIRDTGAPGGFSKDSEEQEMVVDGSLELPSLKLSLKRLRSTGESDIATHDCRNSLKRSDLSAFQRYHASATLTQDLTANGGSSPLDISSEVLKIGSTTNVIYDSNAAPCTGSNGSSDNNDMGSSTKNAFAKPPTFNEKMVSVSAFKSVHSAFHPVQLRTSAQVVQEKNDDANVKQSRGTQHQVQMQQHNHPHNHHRYIHPHDLQQMQVLLNHDAHIVKTLAASASHNGPSIMLTGPNDGNAANYSNHGSNSGSNYGSNRENGSSTAVNAGGVYKESANGMTEINGSSGGDGSAGCSRVEQDRFALREAALNKFRQKRKERNFEKKVRYHSRKRLAEQRPRMRGQFVRRAEFEEAGREADADADR